ncbi:protein aurora borealis [Spodoptera litura]|uniref:Protein aurora borealis n=1 Tax=Spodoptera litura TaxID=69820 RepID=A0A9J7DSR5_SPOLT|nr:protein aurora borealis [Spodoptera litura]
MGDKNDCQNIVYKSTPPPSNRKIRNPFDKALIDKLHKPICSPGMCKIYKKKSNGSFRWDIDQACTLVPTDIVACNSQFEPSPDPALEKIAEEATDKFFSQEMVMPSPLIESSKKAKPLLQTSIEANIQVDSIIKEKVMTKDVSAQTVLTLPPELPPELEKLLQPFCTFTQEQNMSGEYEITANGSLRRKLFFEEHSDMEQYDSEQSDDDTHVEQRPPSTYEAHTPVLFSPDLSRDLVSKGMKRTFGTPLKKVSSGSSKPYRNKILDVVDFGEPCFSPIGFRTPRRTGSVQCQGSATSSSLASISPVMKASSSDEEKNNFTSPETETMATCLDCLHAEPKSEKKGPCFCKLTPNKIKRSTSLKESPPKHRKSSFSFSEKRSLSMSSLHRSRSVQKLDFSMDMSVDGSFHNQSQADSEPSSPKKAEAAWSLVEESSIHHLVKVETAKSLANEIQSSTKIHSVDVNIDDTPVRSKLRSNTRSHEISKIRGPMALSPLHMSLDNSLDNSDNPLGLEHKKIDFNKVDLKLLTENISQFDYTANNMTKVGGDSSTSFKKIDSGFNENTFYVNASSYYESAIKPSELTVTNVSKTCSNKNALKEISNINWMRVDSGFKDETSSDATQFYPSHCDNSVKKMFNFSEAKLEDKENLVAEDYDKFLGQANKNDALSMSDIFTDEMTFNCNFSSTPSKNKSRKVLS